MKIEVLGTGCAKCSELEAKVKQAVAASGKFVQIEKVIQGKSNDYDVIIAAVSHDKYKDMDEKYFKSLTTDNALFVDIKGIYRNKIDELNYWSL